MDEAEKAFKDIKELLISPLVLRALIPDGLFCLESNTLLVVPEKFEPIIFHTYHDSLLVGHQGPYRTAMTIKQRFFIHNLMNKVKMYIEACHCKA